MLIGNIAWILCVLIPQIGNIATIGLSYLVTLFRFIVEVDTGFLMCISIYFLIDPIIIA